MDITKCEYGVLTLSERPLGRNAVTGRFMKGHVPANKGRKWFVKVCCLFLLEQRSGCPHPVAFRDGRIIKRYM